MAVQSINETDTLNQGRVKINAILQQSNESSAKVDGYKTELTNGVNEAKQIATTAGEDAVSIATTAGNQANVKADEALANSKTAITTSNSAVSTANQNKQEFDTLRNEFDELVAESGDSNPEIVQARTDTEGIKQSTLATRLNRDFSNRLTTADAIQLFSGAVNTTKMMNFSGKTVGNTASNPHQAFSDFTATNLKKPSGSWNEITQTNYNSLVSRDDSGVSTGSSQSGVIPQQLYKFNVVEAVKALAPTIFTGMSLTESIVFVKQNFVSFSLSIRGKASAPNNKNLKAATYLESTDSYSTQLQSNATEYTDFTNEINDSNFIDSDGLVNVIVYSDSSNGVTASSIDIDYVGLQIIISLNPLTVLSQSGFAKKDDITKEAIGLGNVTDVEQASKSEFDTFVARRDNPNQVTKDQVGLGNVDNYATATQSDAESGTSLLKFMTPRRVFDAIAKWTSDKFVEATGDQTISGTKNFVNEPTVGGKPFTDKYATLTVSSGFSNGMTGWVKFQRINDLIIVSYSISPTNQNGAWVEILAGSKIPSNFKFADTVYGTASISAAGAVGNSMAVVGVSSTNIQFGAYNRSAGSSAFAGQVIGVALNRGR
ncbi:hypothetical protein [Enterococcus alishanensis]